MKEITNREVKERRTEFVFVFVFAFDIPEIMSR